jgi:hypothetical protein
VPIDLTLENITVAAEESLCYNAKNTLTVAGNNTFFTVSEGAAVTMIAGQSILFLPGATVVSGGNLHGYITSTGEYCIPVSAPGLKAAENTAGKDPGIGSLRIFPNPATSAITVDILGLAETAGSVTDLYGIQGNIISSHAATGSSSFRIDLAAYPAGVYFLRMISGDVVKTMKFVKQ